MRVPPGAPAFETPPPDANCSEVLSTPAAPEHAHRAEIIGLGLIGSSIALRLRRLGWRVTGSDLLDAREKRALELGIIDEVGSDRCAEVVVIATPAASVAAVAASVLEDPARVSADLAPSVNGPAPNAPAVTDVAGVKTRICASVSHPRFVGGHPMAGSEQEGPDGADADLFIGATWVLTPGANTDPNVYTAVRDLVVALGADPIALSPERHDALVAYVSHLPHLTAATLMAVATDASSEHQALLRLAAGGFRDMTRIAAGDPAIWPDIFRDNRDAILAALDSLRARLDDARTFIEQGDRQAIVALLELAKTARRNLPARVPAPEELAECRIPVPDRPGVIAEVTTVLGELGVNIWDLEIAHSAEGSRGVLVLSISAAVANRARDALVERGYHPSIGRLS